MLQKVFNKNTMKISYTFRNSKHRENNQRSQQQAAAYKRKTSEKKCNCNDARKFPFDGNCILENVVYKARVKYKNICIKVYSFYSKSIQKDFTIVNHCLIWAEYKNSTRLASS